MIYAEKGNPLYWFEQNWGSHLYGFPVLIAAVIAVMVRKADIAVSAERAAKLANKKG